MSDLSNHPQNPYASVLVQASAGSGKTYQLSHRFFALVMAGAQPNAICCITFTKATAADMRAKILRLASDVLSRQELHEHFTAQASAFYRAAALDLDPQFAAHLPKPLSADEAAHKILEASQSLRISTIDSLFHDWVRKFPYEAAGSDQPTSAGFSLGSETELSPVRSRAKQQALLALIRAKSDNTWYQQRRSEAGPRGLTTPFDALQSHSALLWLLEQNYNTISKHRVDETHINMLSKSDDDVLAMLAPLARTISDRAGPALKTNIQEALSSASLTKLLECSLFRKEDYSVTGHLREKSRAGIEREIEELETYVRQYFNAKLIQQCNAAVDFFVEAQQEFQRRYSAAKVEESLAEFNDLSRGAFNLFNNPESAGAAYMIQRGIQHLMLDEFQDTNRIQWAIFYQLCSELLSGEGIGATALRPTVFIVGDSKQSIYGFREADPSILSEAQSALEPLGLRQTAMNKSYRSAPQLFSFMNQWFQSLMATYPEHATAANDQAQPVIPNESKIIVAEAFNDENAVFTPNDSGDQEEPTQIEREAKFVAATLRQMIIDEPHLHPVWDGKTLRPLRADDCAILYRNATHARVYEDALRGVGLAAAREETRGYLHRAEIADCIALLRFLAIPQDILSLCTVLRSPLVGLADSVILDLLERTKDLPEEAERTALLLKHLPETFLAKREALHQLCSLAKTTAPHALLLHAFVTLDVKNQYRQHMGAIEGDLAAANLDLFIELCQQIEKQGKTHIVDILAHLETLRADDVIGNATVHRHCITLLTVHKSKGLEFPLVALVDAASPWYRMDPYWARITQSDYAGLHYIGTKKDRPRLDPYFDAVMRNAEDEQKAEAARLLYVSITRAKQYLLVTGTQARSKAANGPSFLDTMLQAATTNGGITKTIDGHRCVALESHADGIKVSEASADLATTPWNVHTVSDNHFPAEVRTVQPHAATSAAIKGSGIRLEFDPQMFGNMIHRALELYVRTGIFPHMSDLLRFAADGGGEACAKAAMQEAKALVASHAWRDLTANAASLSPEIAITYLQGSSLMVGQIDLLVRYQDGSARIVDYKSTAEVTAAADLAEFCRLAGYEQQLNTYSTMLSAMQPSRVAIKRSVLFTKTHQLVDL